MITCGHMGLSEMHCIFLRKMLFKDRCIILPLIAIQVKECSLGTDIMDACGILLVGSPVILAAEG